MKILAHDDIKLQESDILHRVRPSVDSTIQPPRQGGVHLSGVLRTWATQTQVLTPSEWDEDQDVLPLRLFMGLCVEWGISRLYPETEWWPSPVERDGVIGSMDGLAYEPMPVDGEMPQRPIVEEIKYTHMSCGNGRDVPALADRQGVKDWWRRLQQAMGYCNLHPARPRLARFHVVYGVGDYIRPYKERYVRTLVEFSEQELAGNWMNVKKFKRLTKAETVKK